MQKHATGLGLLTLRWRRFTRNDQVILTALAVVIGVAVAYGTIGFRELLAAVQNLLYGFSTEDVFTQLGKLAW
jgi:CIC family chloride channel protein